MSFKDSFAATDQIRASGRKLSEVVERISELEASLSELQQVQSAMTALLDQTRSCLTVLVESTTDLTEQNEYFQSFTAKLPAQVAEIVIAAEARISRQQEVISRVADSLPRLVEEVVAKQLAALLSQTETRLADRLRDELKDTRSTLRDAFEVNSRNVDAKLSEMKQDILAEMPRTIFGRRGR